GQMKSLIRLSHGGRNYRTYIQNQQPATLGTLRPGEADQIPPRWNVQTEGTSPPENLLFLDAAFNCCAKANHDYQMNLRVAVIGHTHHARIAIRETADGN